jgi:cell division protein ZapA (FtsZ GTPase activity inhibitor)
MKEKLQILESLVGQEFQNWNEQTLLTIIGNEEIIREFTPELAIYLIEQHESNQLVNDDIIDVLKPVKYSHYLREVQLQIDSYLQQAAQKKITKDEFETLINTMINDGGTLQKAGAYLTILMILDTDIRNSKAEIEKILSEIIDIIDSLNIDNAFEIDQELVDLYTAIRESYAQKYQENLHERKEDIERIMNMLDEKLAEIQTMLAEMGYGKDNEDEENVEEGHVHDENCGHEH